MEGNDIQTFAPIQQACMFEGVLASPPSKTSTKMRAVKALRQHEWNRYVGLWQPHEMSIKSLVDSVRRRKIGVEVYTLIHEDMVDAIDGWLYRKGVSLPVYYFPDLATLSEDLKYHHPSLVVHVSTQEQAQAIGIKARVTDTFREWVL